MTPRSYRMTKRAVSTEETRQRIVEATLSLHTEKGFRATSWQDIAERADVAVGTVYYHFPTFDELIPACSGLGIERAAPPTPAIFEGLRGKRARVDCLVDELYGYYERAGEGVQHMLREKDGIPALRRLAEEQRDWLRTLIAEALGQDTKKEQADLIETLLDFPVWLSLSERGMRKEVAVKVMTRLTRCAMQHA